ncbi:MAG: hypothetical protein KG003_02660 [Bacteroidetes bacterium]|nr:hypothetical protein [Bacteroidota bacterium]
MSKVKIRLYIKVLKKRCNPVLAGSSPPVPVRAGERPELTSVQNDAFASSVAAESFARPTKSFGRGSTFFGKKVD